MTFLHEPQESFLADAAKLEKTREFLAKPEGLTEDQIKTLKIFERTFGCYIMESATAREKREESMKLEGSLESQRNTMKLGAQLKDGFQEMSSVGLRNKMRTSPDEAERKACYEGLRSIGPFVVANGFVEVVKARNAMAKALGYVDYYDYKVSQAEGFNKQRLFEILDTLEAGTRFVARCLVARARRVHTNKTNVNANLFSARPLDPLPSARALARICLCICVCVCTCVCV